MNSNHSESSSVVRPLTASKYTRLPSHIAVIMDGNGRWAKKHGLPRTDGHKEGAKAVKNIVESCLNRGIKYLTLFSFSTENWNRDKSEINNLMDLLSHYLESEVSDLISNGIRLRTIGDINKFPLLVRRGLKRSVEISKNNTKLNLTLALNYGGREEIVNAAKRLVEKVEKDEIQPSEITNEVFSDLLWTSELPDPDLLIRSSGEMRISNFLLWQLAYTEIVVTQEFWPDFSDEIFEKCLIEYAKRERRFGLTSDQVENGAHFSKARKLGYTT